MIFIWDDWLKVMLLLTGNGRERVGPRKHVNKFNFRLVAFEVLEYWSNINVH